MVVRARARLCVSYSSYIFWKMNCDLKCNRRHKKALNARFNRCTCTLGTRTTAAWYTHRDVDATNGKEKFDHLLSFREWRRKKSSEDEGGGSQKTMDNNENQFGGTRCNRSASLAVRLYIWRRNIYFINNIFNVIIYNDATKTEGEGRAAKIIQSKFSK